MPDSEGISCYQLARLTMVEPHPTLKPQTQDSRDATMRWQHRQTERAARKNFLMPLTVATL